jgi:adenylate cyclase
MEINTQARILIVDDAPENIDVLQNLLQGYKMSVALNGEKALKLASGPNKPDLILLDIMMPGIDGYEVIRRLKADESTKEIPVIFITALTEATDETKGFSLGAADYISKPFQPDVVKARVLTQLILQANKLELMRLNAKLVENNEIIEAERKRADDLLNNILPELVIKDLKEKGSTEPRLYQNASVLFLDIEGFSKLASHIAPRILIDELNEIFSDFDSITDIYSCERIKTIGDSYMAVCGVPEENAKHAQLLMSAAIDFLSYIKERNEELREGQHEFKIRI